MIKHSKGRARGVQTYIFAQDMPITDFQFELIKERFEDKLSTENDKAVDN
ncbi:hypothetical protein SGODD07_01844 [Streptococcus gordonii]|uniref:Uncharacterized protein n=1 Tax=Streptococcus gordonii TaxID=1302 RepID=A0A139MZY2_STRGN|nr:hypothetical protein SGODD07_01844 [Streptococcus gordonii]